MRRVTRSTRNQNESETQSPERTHSSTSELTQHTDSSLSWTSHEPIRYNLRSRSIPKVDMTLPLPESKFLSTQPIVGAYSRLDPNNTNPTRRLCPGERKQLDNRQTYHSKPTMSKSWMTHHQLLTAQHQWEVGFSRKCTNFDGTFTDALDRVPFSIEDPSGSSNSGQTTNTAFRRSVSPESLSSRLGSSYGREEQELKITQSDTTTKVKVETTEGTKLETQTEERSKRSLRFRQRSNMMFIHGLSDHENEFSVFEETNQN
ncbi:hypothetical protein A0J61_07058 [Choanephora cucurbitarum]|uniref:Uncharacterized protein n=1 Tax=Choanephora cucurbitarum TaxID=101091 RepID=A0A1C7N722_9FUNG|nr:hypothetical protein A0J61_07058 [Choanephora cucurbitarum]